MSVDRNLVWRPRSGADPQQSLVELARVYDNARRTILDLDARIVGLQSQLTALAAKSNGNTPLSPLQAQQVAGLIAGRSQAVFGQDVQDPQLPGQLGNGTVTSVSITGPSIIGWTGSPVTGTGGFTGTLANQNANLVLAGPASGAAAMPTFRALVAADMAESNLTGMFLLMGA